MFHLCPASFSYRIQSIDRIEWNGIDAMEPRVDLFWTGYLLCNYHKLCVKYLPFESKMLLFVRVFVVCIQFVAVLA